MSLPAVCAELRLRVADYVPVVNSRDVAEMFGKQHAHVLRDIDALKINPNLDISWFRPSIVLDNYNREQPSYNLTRDGFMLLVMGWNGERAMALKIQYIEAFNAMERDIRDHNPPAHDLIVSAIRELVAPLAVRFDGQDVMIERVGARVDALAQDVGTIKLKLFSGRSRIKPAVKFECVEITRTLGGRCPSCGIAEVIVDGQRSKFAEFDHFYQNSRSDLDHIWLICMPCHSDLTSGRVPRHQREAAFRAYQDKRLHIPGQQIAMHTFF